MNRLKALNFLVPGLGHAVMGSAPLALSHTLVLATLIAVFCWLQLPSTLVGLSVTLTCVLIAHALYSVIGQNKELRPWLRVRSTLVYALIMLAFTAAPINKEEISLGYKIYFIPSASMQPTLYPGDIILVKLSQPPAHHSAGQVVVFKSPTEGKEYIKRIAHTPEHLKGSAYKHYMLGDNPENSEDSRVYGLIDNNAIKGDARIMLMNISMPSRNLIEIK